MLKSVNVLAYIRFAVYLYVIITDPLTPTHMTATTATVTFKNQVLTIVDLPTLAEYQEKYPALAKHDNGYVRGVAQGKKGAYYGFFFNWATGEVQQVQATPYIK